ncbi:MAG: hypothetical protein U0228_06900 [Myxococcaceae bacterium]
MTTRSSSSAAAAEAARQRAAEEARRRAAEEARRKAAAEAAKKAAEAAAKAKAQAQAKANKFKKDEMSTGKGGALRRNSSTKLAALGLDAKAIEQPNLKLSATSVRSFGMGRGPDGVRMTMSADQAERAAQAKAANATSATSATQATAKPDPVKDAASVNAIKDPAAKAKKLESLVTSNPDPAYRKQLLDAAKPAIEDISRKVVDKDSGATKEQRQAALDSLGRTTELLDADSQQALVKTVAGTMKNQNVGDDDDEFGTMLKNSIKSGAGASFGVRLASELQGTGKTTAANDTSKFVGQAINDVKKDFEEANKKVDDLHVRLAQELPQWQLSGADQTKALKAFDEQNHLKDATNDLESKAALLASVENGAGLAATDPVLTKAANERVPAGRGGSFPKYGNEGDLVSAAKGAMQDIPELANTKAGAQAIGDAVKAQGQGRTTFLDQAKDVLKDVKDGAKILQKLRGAVLQASGVALLNAASTGNFEAEKSALLAGLQKNAKLLGTTEDKLADLGETLNKFKPGMAEEELSKLTEEAGAKITKLGASDSALSQSLKGLTVVFGAVAAVKDWANFSDADMKTKLATITETLSVGKQGADFVASTLSRFASSAATDAEVASTVGLTAGKLLGAGIGVLGTVVSGWQAFDAFKDGKIQEGVGDTMAAIGGAVATAGLFLDGTIAGAPAGVVLNIAGGVIAAAGAVVTLFAGHDDPFEGQQDDLGKMLESIGVKHEVAEQLKDFNGDGQNLGTWVSAVAKKLNMTPGDFVRSMNGWTEQQVTNFIDAARLQHDTDGNNGHRHDNAAHVLGQKTADALEDPPPAFYGRGGVPPGATEKRQKALDAQKAARVQVDEDTGALTYNQSAIDAAAQWVQNGRP